MANRAVFVDRDQTLIEDPGYLADLSAVKLLPGVELAIKSLSQAGFKIVVVTNQSAIARGLLTEDTLGRIHAEVRRQLAEKGAHLDAIYYCPYHPEGTVEAYAKNSDFRKPQPGMLLKASVDLNLDLVQSWMVGDSPRDIEAGQRAGCRTIRIRTPRELQGEGTEDEDVQADFVVRNLVDAARIVLRESPPVVHVAPATVSQPLEASSASSVPSSADIAPVPAGEGAKFSASNLLVGLLQVLVVVGVALGLVDGPQMGLRWILSAIALQLVIMTLLMIKRL